MKVTPKAIMVLGPTACGKSDLAVDIALNHNGEIISADSRQVYKKLNIGTGKITILEMKGISHHLLDIINPNDNFSVAEYKKLAEDILQKIILKNKLPIICGGTGFYIQSLTHTQNLPQVEPNNKLRATLSKLTAPELFKKLQKLDPVRAESIDPNNTHRLIRAIEIATALGNVPRANPKPRTDISFLKIGIMPDDATIKERIYNRLLVRLDDGMLAEAKKLHKNGLSCKRMDEFGLEYRYMARFLTGKISKQEMIDRLAIEIWHYAKRQKTWFKRDEEIHWFKDRNDKKIQTLVKKFLKE